jgi:phosphoribosylglycinamide formyltransferase 1
MPEFKLAILASGSGSTGEVLFDRASLVVVSDPHAGIIKRVEEFTQRSNKNLPYVVLDRSKYSSKGEFGEELLKILKEHQINFISQNGWTVFTPENVLKEFDGRIINAHPGPLDPGYLDFGGKGMNDLAVHSAVLYFAKNIQRPFKTEITLHQVTGEFDKGDLVALREVEIFPDDTPEKLQQRLKDEERKLLKEFWDEVETTGEIRIISREKRVILEGEEETLVSAKNQAISGHYNNS